MEQTDAQEQESATGQRPPRDDVDELVDSFAAFKVQLSQGRELKKMRRELDRHHASLKKSRGTYKDNLDILDNFESIVAAQNDIIEGSNRLIESLKASAKQAESEASRLTRELSCMKEEHERALQPESEELYRRSSELSNANGVVKACKSERDSLRAFAHSDDGSAERERYDRAQADLVLATDKRDAARVKQREAQRAYDAKAKSFEREQGELESAVKRQKKEKARAEKEIEQLEEKVGAARKRIAYCEHVREHPAETARLGRAIEEGEAAEAEMSAQVDALDAEHAASKIASSRARVLVIGAIIVAVIVAVVAVIVSTR